MHIRHDIYGIHENYSVKFMKSANPLKFCASKIWHYTVCDHCGTSRIRVFKASEVHVFG